MRNNRLASFSIAAVTTLLTFGVAGCGDLKDIADDILSHEGDGAGGAGGAGGSGGSGGAGGSSESGCDYEGKTYPLGSSFPSTDGCNVCSCDKTGGVACTLKACAEPPPSPSCEKVPVTTTTGECLPFTTWKVQLEKGEVCAERGESMNTLSFGEACADGASSREVIVVCCKATPANDVTCAQSADANGASCTVCTDASGKVVKTDCGNKQ
jgi:Pacifastin inhibitor (LCMII)